MMPNGQKNDGREESYQFRVNRHENVPVLFSNNFVVQVDGPGGSEFHLRFYQLKPPVLLGTAEEKRELVNEMQGRVDAECVAHIVLPRGRMEEFMKMLAEHAQKHLEGKPQ